jgi:hypothetical protein
MNWFLRWILHFYPPAFRREFGDEVAAVFRQSAVEKRSQGRLALAGWLLVELFSGLRVALRLRFNELEQGVNMGTIPLIDRDNQVPRWAIPAILVFFLVMALPYKFYALFPSWMSSWLPLVLLLLAFVTPLFGGLRARLPRWSMLYTGAVLGGIGFYGAFIILGILGLLLRPVLESLMDRQDTLTGRLFYEWILNGLIWLGIGLANGLFLGLVAFTPGLHGQWARFWRDFSLVSFSLYGGILIVYMVDFDDYSHEELYVLASMAALGLGAWGYLRAKTAVRRTLSLLAGLTVCMTFMGVGKYFLVPLQDWGPWLPSHPPETERWFESLRTIATWFWAALFVGLPGLAQALRKTPPAQSAPTTI